MRWRYAALGGTAIAGAVTAAYDLTQRGGILARPGVPSTLAMGSAPAEEPVTETATTKEGTLA